MIWNGFGMDAPFAKVILVLPRPRVLLCYIFAVIYGRDG